MKNINQLVNSQLTGSIKNYDKLSDFVYKLMHLDKSKHNLWVITKQQQLTLLTDNPYLGTQLQYQMNVICAEINKHFLLQLKKTKVKIVPPSATPVKPDNKLYEIGEKASMILANIAEEIDDEELKMSLLKLTKNKSNNQTT